MSLPKPLQSCIQHGEYLTLHYADGTAAHYRYGETSMDWDPGRDTTNTVLWEAPSPNPAPVPGKEVVYLEVIERIRYWKVPGRAALSQSGLAERLRTILLEQLEKRVEHGIRKYGTPLMTHNGRSALRDAWEEAFDLLFYAEQDNLEGDHGGNQIAIGALDMLFLLTAKLEASGELGLACDGG